MVKVEFFINDNKVGEDNLAPFSYDWNTRTVSNGEYTLLAKAWDSAGNQITSIPVKVKVANDYEPPDISDVCTQDKTGNFELTPALIVNTPSYGWRALSAIESSEIWFEDFGTGQLVNGEATITFEPIFTETINTTVPYHVFVTPLSDTPVILTVSSKAFTGFTVKGFNLDGSPANVSFDYRINAKRLGYENKRLESHPGPPPPPTPAPIPSSYTPPLDPPLPPDPTRPDFTLPDVPMPPEPEPPPEGMAGGPPGGGPG